MANIIKISSKHFNKKRLGIICVVAAIIIGGAVATWIYISGRDSSPKSQIAKRAEDINKIVGDAQKLANSGEIKDAKAVYDDVISVTEDQYKKSMLLVAKATILYNNKNYDEALDVALEAEKADQNATAAKFIAQVYEAKDNNQKAIEYYQKAVGLTDQSSPLARSDIKFCQNKIKLLGGAES